jgi:hypothetical protein
LNFSGKPGKGQNLPDKLLTYRDQVATDSLGRLLSVWMNDYERALS